MADCPKCGKKMSKRKDTCKRCGYTVNPEVSPINYYMRDAKSPNIVYPMTVSKEYAQENPFGANKSVRKNRCPKCARRLGENKQYCKCGYERPNFVNQKGSRWFGFFLAIFAVLAILVIPYSMVVGFGEWDNDFNNWILVFESTTLLKIFEGEGLWFEALPVFDFWGETGYLYNLFTYSYLLFGALAALQAFFAIFSKVKATKRVRRALFLLGVGALLYSIGVIGASTKFALPEEKIDCLALHFSKVVIDLASTVIAVVCLFSSFVLKRIAKKQAKRLAKNK